MQIEIGQTESGKAISIPLSLANRHGLVTGMTGTGKTVTLQSMAEQFSAAGVPVFAADVKGDLSGIAAAGDPEGKAAARSAALGRPWSASSFPVALWDIFGVHGVPVRSSVQEMGPLLLAAMLRLNEVQSGALAIAFRKAEDDQDYLLSLDDLRWQIGEMADNREDVSRQYGNVTGSSLAAIQRNLLALEAQGGQHLFGEPPFDILDFMRHDADGRGVVNLLHADTLMENPALYAVFLLWILTELFRRLPEAGDLDKPRLVFFFDEAHLLFTDAPKPLLQQIERLVRLVRSKGVGVYFVTQSPADVPDIVLSQLGNRIQHGLRAYTPKDQRMIRAAAQAFRPNPALKVREVITELGIGEALVSVLQPDGSPTMVERVRIVAPQGQIGPISDLERSAIVEASEGFRKYRAPAEKREAVLAFTNRQRERRGLAPIAAGGPEWKEGDYRQFVPIPPMAAWLTEGRKPRPRYGLQAMIGLAVAVGCFWWLGAL